MKFMKNQIIISLFLLAAFCAAPVFAQKTDKTEKPNFNGIWESSVKSLYRFGTSFSITTTSRKLFIVQDKEIFKISCTEISEDFDENKVLLKKDEKILPSWIFYLDNRGEINLSEENESVESSTKWDGKKIIFTYKLKYEESHYLVSEYSLSKKADELTVFTKMLKKQTNPKNDKKSKFVLLSSWIDGYKKVIE